MILGAAASAHGGRVLEKLIPTVEVLMKTPIHARNSVQLAALQVSRHA